MFVADGLPLIEDKLNDYVCNNLLEYLHNYFKTMYNEPDRTHTLLSQEFPTRVKVYVYCHLSATMIKFEVASIEDLKLWMILSYLASRGHAVAAKSV